MRGRLYGIKGKDAVKAFVRAGGIEKRGKGDHINVKMPNGMIITIPDRNPIQDGILSSLDEGADNRRGGKLLLIRNEAGSV